MFIKENALKSMMRAAYKNGGLHAWNNAGDIALGAAGWAVYIFKEYVTKEIKGEIMTLTGEIPDMGRQYEATKEGNQEEMPGTFGMDVFREAGKNEKTGCRILDTLVSVRGVFGVYRIYTGVEDRPVILRESKAGLISQSYCDGEERLEDPISGENGKVFFCSNTMAMSVWEMDFEEVREKDPEAAEVILKVFERLES